MKVLNISAKLINIYDEFGNYFFEVQCGNGPMVFAASQSREIVVPFVSSSASVAHLSINIIGKVGSVKKLFGSKVAKIRCSTHSESVDMIYSKETGDQIDVMVKVKYELVHCPLFDTIKHLNGGQGLNVSVSFVDTMKEDLSVRVLNDQGSCLSMSTIDALTMSVFVTLHREHKNMEVSIAGKNSGVITIPIENNLPLVTKIASYPSGYILISIQLIQGAVGRVLCLDDVLCDAPKDEQYVYHLENIRMDVEETAPVNVPAISCGVVYGPILARLELPSFPASIVGRITYSMPCSSINGSANSSETTEGGDPKSPRRLTFDNNVRGLIVSDDTPEMPVRLRLSVIRVIDSDDSDKEHVNEGPCGIVLISAMLKEIDREMMPPTAATVAAGESDADVSPKDETVVNDRPYPARVSIAGEIDYVADLPGLQYQTGDRLAASVFLSAIEPSPIEAETEENPDLLQAESTLEALKNPTPRVVVEPVSVLPVLKQSLDDVSSPNGQHSSQDTVSAGAGGSIIQLLSDELREKQRVIHRLMDDNSTKAEAISKHSAEFSVFQREISQLKTKLAETQAALSYREQESDAAVRLAEEGADTPESLFSCSRQRLIDAVVHTTKRFHQVDKERLELKKIITDSVSIRRQFGDMQKAYRDLQDAHVKQARHIQKMQIQQSKVATYESTILLQEKVISKMQSAIEAHLKASNDSSRLASEGTRHDMLIDRSVNKMDAKRSNRTCQMDTGEISALRERCHTLEAQIRSKDIRLEALEDQLVRSSQEAAREIASLRMKVFDLEMTGGGSSVGDPDELDKFKIERSTQSALLIPYENMAEKSGNSKAPSRGTTANSSIYADLGGKVYVPAGSNSKRSTPPSPPVSSGRVRKVNMDNDALSVNREHIGSREQIQQGVSSREGIAGRRNKPFMEHAYRPDSKTGSPRPVSPSETSDIGSFGASPRMPSNFPIASARNSPYDAELRLPLTSPNNSAGLGLNKLSTEDNVHSHMTNRSGQSLNTKGAGSPIVNDALQSLLGEMGTPQTEGTPPPLGDLSQFSGDDTARKQSVNSVVRSSRSAGSGNGRV